MPKELKPGDRVAVYGRSAHDDFTAIGNRGTVMGKHSYRMSENTLGVFDIEFAGQRIFQFFPQQCRRLIKKKRMEYWIKPQCIGCPGIFQPAEVHMTLPIGRDDLIHVREIKK